MDELSGDGHERLAVGFPVGALLGVVVVERGLELKLRHRRQVERAAQAGRPLFRYAVVLGRELARLADGGVDAGVLHDGGRAVEAADVADLRHYLGAEHVADAGNREDERLDGLDAVADPGLHLVDLPFHEVDLVDEQLDLVVYALFVAVSMWFAMVIVKMAHSDMYVRIVASPS